LWSQSRPAIDTPECQVYMIYQSEPAQRMSATLAEQLRDAGLRVIVHAGSSGFKSQFKRADASGAVVAVIIGEQEHQNNEVSIKWLRADLIENDIQQETIPANRLVDAIKQKV